MRRLPCEAAAEVASQLLGCTWSWTTSDLDTPLRAAGLVAPDPLEGMSIRIQHPDLPDVDGFVATLADETTVLEIAVTLTEVIDEADEAAAAELDDAYEEYDAFLKVDYGDPTERPRDKGAVWDRGDQVLELAHHDIAVVLVVASKDSRRKRHGG